MFGYVTRLQTMKPTSTGTPSQSRVCAWPPTWSPASSSSTRQPALASACAAARPAQPEPTTQTDFISGFAPDQK